VTISIADLKIMSMAVLAIMVYNIEEDFEKSKCSIIKRSQNGRGKK